MTDSLKGKVAVVTGAAHGMGEAIARAFAREGATLGLIDRQFNDLEKVVCDIQALGSSVTGRSADVRKYAEIEESIQVIESSLGPIDILVNSAGLGIYKPFEELTEDDWDTTLDVNAKGTFLMCKAVVPGMVKRQQGLIINIASLAAVISGFPTMTCYSASKYAVEGFSCCLGVELKPKGVRVCCLCPGTTDSHFRGRPTGNPDWMTPDDVASAALYVATQRGRVSVHEIIFSMVNEGWP